MDLREKIEEVISAADGRYEHADSDTITDAVMEVVEEDAVKRRAYTELRVELARKAEAAKWETRVRELEEENQRMREYLSHAVKFSFGTDMASHAEVTRAEQNRPDGNWFFRSWGPTERHATQEAALEAALSRDREIAEEEA